jgi:hypothetical protein
MSERKVRVRRQVSGLTRPSLMKIITVADLTTSVPSNRLAMAPLDMGVASIVPCARIRNQNILKRLKKTSV